MARTRTGVDQDNLRSLADHGDVVHQLKLFASLPGRLQHRLALGPRSLRIDQEGRRQNEMPITHHQHFKIARLGDCPLFPVPVEQKRWCRH